MKDTIKIIISFSLVGILLVSMGISIVKIYKEQNPAPKEYATCATVIEVDKENNIVTVEDFNGNLWEFEGCEDWLEGDIAAMIMNNNGTQYIYDDIIESVRYCGYNY